MRLQELRLTVSSQCPLLSSPDRPMGASMRRGLQESAPPLLGHTRLSNWTASAISRQLEAPNWVADAILSFLKTVQ